MLDFSKNILSKVSFDKALFQKELEKCVRWLSRKESITLKIWALSTFSEYTPIILNVFDKVA
tara:strand:+ start:1847 stop:2032 length:186 start_codon:yes stop_codon:yes gene_type:complete